MGNIVTASFTKGRIYTAPSVFQYNVGMKLRFKGIELPGTYRVDFSNTLRGASKAMLGDADGVEIPYEYFVPGSSIYAWIVLSAGENNAITEYQAEIPISPRAKPTDETPFPSQKSAIDQAIAALNAAADRMGYPFEKSVMTYKGVTIERQGNTITINGTGTESGTANFNLSGGGILLKNDSNYTLPLQSGHSYAMSGTFSGTAQNPSSAPLGDLVSAQLDGAGIRINKEMPNASGAVLSADAEGKLLLAVRLGTTIGGTVYPITYTAYKIILETEDHLIME